MSVLSTGSVRIRPEHVASNGTPELVWLLTSRSWTQPRPINVYVLEHRDGLVLFDAGQDRASVTDSRYFPSGPIGFLYGRLARFAIDPLEDLSAQLASLGYSVADVTKVVLSHLHQDHIGGLAQLRHAEISVSRAEWEAVRKPFPLLRGFMRDHIELPGLRWNFVEFSELSTKIGPFERGFDLMGDGSMMLLPTPGHTPGSLSMLVTNDDAPLLFVGDLTYSCDLMHDDVIPGVGKPAELRASTARVLELARSLPGLRILAAHDPAARAILADAPTRCSG